MKIQPYIEFISSKAAAAPFAPLSRDIVSVAFVVLMATLNIPVIQNLMARRQMMNGSFDRLRLANTYGAFGTVAETRIELIIESASNIDGPWKEYQFKVKPGDVHRSPRWISPYHYRLDWQMWIASQLGRVERSPWIYSFLLKLLNQEMSVIDLLETDPWLSEPDKPRFIRVEKYKYKFYNRRKGDHSREDKSQYWTREKIGRFFPREGVMTAAILSQIAETT